MPAGLASRPASPAYVAAAAPSALELCAPVHGIVHLRPSPDEPPFVKAGDAVAAGQTLCVIEAMKVFNEVRARSHADLRAVLVASGQEVEAGQPLFSFEDAGEVTAQGARV